MERTSNGHLTRRQWIAGCGAVGLAGLLPTRARSYEPGARLLFEVLRNNGRFGSHEVKFSERGGDTIVDISIELQVRAAFVTFFKYSHTNREVWRDGRLVQITTRTNDNGKPYAVDGAVEGDEFVFESALGRQVAPANVIPTSYWNPLTQSQSTLLDTQRGRLLSVAIEPVGREVLDKPVGQILAQKYRMTGDLELDLWYSDEGQWSKCAFEVRGSKVDYRLIEQTAISQ